MRRNLTATRSALTAIMAGAVVLLSSAISFAGVPTLGADCGIGASIAGSDSAGKVTLGQGTTSCTLTFSVSYTNAPACSATNETNGGSFPAPTGAKTTNATLVIGSASGSNRGDVISYSCQDY
jgi:hypothetical protein